MHNKPLLIDVNTFLHQDITRIELFRSTIQLMIANIDIVKWFQHCLVCIMVCMKDENANTDHNVNSFHDYHSNDYNNNDNDCNYDYLCIIPCNCRMFIFEYVRILHESVKSQHQRGEENV